MQDKKTLYIFPTSRSIREFIYGFKNQNTLLPSTITIDEFLKKSISINDFSYETKEQRVIILNEAIKNIELSKLGLNKSFAQFLKQYDYIYRFFLELSSERKEIKDISSVDTYLFYEEHLKILDEILINYKRLLKENKLVNKINIDEIFVINKEFIKRFDKIEINFEGYFTQQEFNIINKISENIPLFINFHKNKYNTKSLKIFENIYQNFQDGFNYKINLSLKQIIKEELDSKIKPKIEIKGFSNRLNQIPYIKSTIVNLVNSGVEASKIVLVLPNENFVKNLELNDNEKYFNFAMGKDILNTNLYQKVYAIFNYILEENDENIEFLKFLKLDRIFVNNNIKSIWNNSLTKDNFNNISEFVKKDEINKELIQKYDELVYSLNSIFFSTINALRVKDAFKIFLQNLVTIKLDDVNSGKITVMGVLETRLIEFDAVIICDFNEEFVPKISTKDKFLSTKVKKLADLPTKKDRENLQKYYYKRLIDNSKQCFISYFNGKDSSVSRFAYELFSYKEEKFFDEEYKDILYKSNKLEYVDEKIELKLDLKQFIWSASALKTFLDCKRKWYLNYILKLKEHTVSNMPKSFELGNIIHTILENYYKSDISNIDELFENYRAKNPFLTLELEIYKTKIKRFIQEDKERLKSRSILALERKFDIEFNNFKLQGIIDRIDKYEDNYELIDYKTSRNLSVDTMKNYDKSKDFQMSFYYLAVRELYKTEKIKAYFYDIFNNTFVEEEVLLEKTDILKTILDELKELSKEKIDFSKTNDKSSCEYCSYKTICNKN